MFPRCFLAFWPKSGRFPIFGVSYKKQVDVVPGSRKCNSKNYTAQKITQFAGAPVYWGDHSKKYLETKIQKYWSPQYTGAPANWVIFWAV